MPSSDPPNNFFSVHILNLWIVACALLLNPQIGALSQERKAMPEIQSSEQQISEAYRQMYRAMIAKDTRSLSLILTDDFRLIHITGYDQHRSEWLEQIDNHKMQYFSSEEINVEVAVNGDKAQLRGRNLVNASIWGSKGTWPLQLDVEVLHQNGRWKIKHARASIF